MSALGMMVHTYCSYSNMRADFFRVVGARSWSRIVGDSIAGWDGLGGSYPAEGAFPLSLPDTASQPYGETEAAGKSVLLSFDPTARMRAEGAVLLADGDAEAAYEKLREAYASLARERDWGSESIMAEIRRLCRARGLPDPGAEG